MTAAHLPDFEHTLAIAQGNLEAPELAECHGVVCGLLCRKPGRKFRLSCGPALVASSVAVACPYFACGLSFFDPCYGLGRRPWGLRAKFFLCRGCILLAGGERW